MQRACTGCGTMIGVYETYAKGRCQACHTKAMEGTTENKRTGKTADVIKAKREEQRNARIDAAVEESNRLHNFVLTTETAHNLPVAKRLGIVSAETVFGMNVLKDMLGDLRGTFGGRSDTMQSALRDGRETCLRELKSDALKLGADAVVGIDLDYHDLGTTGRMLMIVATGTAVKLATEKETV